MKKEYQYLIAGVAISAAVLLGMGVVGDEKQVTEGRYQFLDFRALGNLSIEGSVKGPTFGVIDSQTGTVNYVASTAQVVVLPFAATKGE